MNTSIYKTKSYSCRRCRNDRRKIFSDKGILFVEIKESIFSGSEIKKSEEYADTKILVYNSMINATSIIAGNS
jgi:hypothetical protein